MNRVRNCLDRAVEVCGWRFLPKSTYAIDPSGRKTDHIPAVVAFSAQAKRLADLGLLHIDGYSVVLKPVLVQPPTPPAHVEAVEPVAETPEVPVEETPVEEAPVEAVHEEDVEEGSDEPGEGVTVEPGRKKRKRR